MKITRGRFLLCFFSFLYFCNSGYPGYCNDKTRKEFYPDGKLKAIYSYNGAGLLDGVVRRYFNNGKLQREQTYHNNIKEGSYRIYYESGNLQEEGVNKNGQRDGKTKTYYESGKLKVEYSSMGGKLEGMQKLFYENGKLWSCQNFKANKPITPLICYDKQGAEIKCPDNFYH